MKRLERLLSRLVEPGVVLRLAALVVCVMEIGASVMALLGMRAEPYDGLIAGLYRRLGGQPDDKALLLLGLALLCIFAATTWRLTREASDGPPRHALAWLVLIDLLAYAVTPGLPFLVTALAAVLLPAGRALVFGLVQVLLNAWVSAGLPGFEVAGSGWSAWLDGLNLLMSMLFLHGLAFGLGRMAASEAEKRRLLQVMLAERVSGEALLAEQTRYGERMQIARELHDLMGHHLAALSLHLQLGDALLTRDDRAGTAQALSKAQGVAAHLLADVREAVSQQRGSQRIDLSQALQALADGIVATRIELEMDDSARDLGPRTAHALLRSVQEAVTNSVRHAGAKRVHVQLTGQGEFVAVSIDDDGRGAPRWTPGRAGNGLTGMAERMSELGGQMRVARSSPGFRIELTCPRTA
jgi:signal transduction histidine kinase